MGRIQDVKDEVRYIQEDPSGYIWFFTSYNGLYRIKHPVKYSSEKKDLLNIENEVDFFDQSNGLPGQKGIIPLEFDGSIIFSCSEGLLSFSEQNESFIPFSDLGSDLADGESMIYRFEKDNKGSYWAYVSSDDEKWMERIEYDDHQKKYIRTTSKLSRLPEMSIQSIYSKDSALVWIGGTGGLYSYDRSKTDEADSTFLYYNQPACRRKRLCLLSGNQIVEY